MATNVTFRIICLYTQYSKETVVSQILCTSNTFGTTGGNRTMVAAATIVSMVATDGERITIFPLVWPNKARCVSFSTPDI